MTTRAQLSKSAEHEGGHTNLMRAALQGRTEGVKTLLEGGADANEKDDEGRTALMFAVTNIQKDSVNLLLDHGADVNATANDGGTALLLAASSGDSEIVRALLSKGAYVTGKFHATGKTALMLAKEKDYGEIAKLLQEAGAKNQRLVRHGFAQKLAWIETVKQRASEPGPIATGSKNNQSKTVGHQQHRMRSLPPPMKIKRRKREIQKAFIQSFWLSETFRWYDLRHTTASVLLRAGTNPKILVEKAGHASVNLTLNVYSHTIPSMQYEAANDFEKALCG